MSSLYAVEWGTPLTNSERCRHNKEIIAGLERQIQSVEANIVWERRYMADCQRHSMLNRVADLRKQKEELQIETIILQQWAENEQSTPSAAESCVDAKTATK